MSVYNVETFGAEYYIELLFLVAKAYDELECEAQILLADNHAPHRLDSLLKAQTRYETLVAYCDQLNKSPRTTKGDLDICLDWGRAMGLRSIC